MQEPMKSMQEPRKSIPEPTESRQKSEESTFRWLNQSHFCIYFTKKSKNKGWIKIRIKFGLIFL